MPIIDVDAHLIEGDQTWLFMLEEERHLAPEKLVPEKTGIEFWRFEDRVLASSNVVLNVPAESRDMTDVTALLKHMDALGIDVQMLYPTLFLRPTTARADVEPAVYHPAITIGSSRLINAVSYRRIACPAHARCCRSIKLGCETLLVTRRRPRRFWRPYTFDYFVYSRRVESCNTI
jgi:hypothetical protein